MDYYKVSEEQIVYLSHSFINNTIIIKFRLKVNKEIEALQMVHLTKSTFNKLILFKLSTYIIGI